MTDGHAAHYEHGYDDGEAWPREVDVRRSPPAPPPRPGAWEASGEGDEHHVWPDAPAATASAVSDRGGAGVTASACVRTPVFSKASICIDAQLFCVSSNVVLASLCFQGSRGPSLSCLGCAPVCCVICSSGVCACARSLLLRLCHGFPLLQLLRLLCRCC